MIRKVVLGLTVGLSLLVAGNASALVLDPFARGSYRGDLGVFGTGGAGTAIGNFQTGTNGPELRSFFAYDLSGISGTVTAAKFSINLLGTFGSGATGTPQQGQAPITIETVSLFEVTGDVGALVSNAGGLAAFDDLGDGYSYGSNSASTDARSGILDFTFDADGLARVNAAVGGSFALGGALTSIAGGPFGPLSEFLFGDSFDIRSFTRLDLTVVPVPGPSSLLLLLAGIGLIGAGRMKVCAT